VHDARSARSGTEPTFSSVTARLQPPSSRCSAAAQLVGAASLS
jgi:hypothetical protein